MAKSSSIQTNKNRQAKILRYAERRQKIKDLIYDKSISPDERFAHVIKLAKLPRNSAKCRYRNRCEISGRSRGIYRRFMINRVALREFASNGFIPGLTKSSW